MKLRNRQIETDLHIKPTDTHQFLDSTSCHPYHCKKSIPYGPALRYNRIFSDNENFDQLCNDLEKWLMERGCSERMVRTQILKTSSESRDSLLEWGNTRTFESKLTFSIIYYPPFQNGRSMSITAFFCLPLCVRMSTVTFFVNLPVCAVSVSSLFVYFFDCYPAPVIIFAKFFTVIISLIL